MKGVMWFGKKGKLNAQYVSPYLVLKKFGTVVCELKLPPSLSSIHLMFHISINRKCVGDPSTVVP